jgi:hypothetical protein
MRQRYCRALGRAASKGSGSYGVVVEVVTVEDVEDVEDVEEDEPPSVVEVDDVVVVLCTTVVVVWRGSVVVVLLTRVVVVTVEGGTKLVVGTSLAGTTYTGTGRTRMYVQSATRNTPSMIHVETRTRPGPSP